MRLCRKYMAAQTRQPDQWLILNGPEPMPLKVLNAIESGAITGECIVFWEDDDAFAKTWIEWCAEQIERGFEIVGEGNAVYYQIRYRWWSECRNKRHAALVQTAIHADLLPQVANVIRSYQSPFFDTRIWCLDVGRYLHMPTGPQDRRVVGIKGMFGAKGYSGEHNQLRPPESNTDPSLEMLHRWIGDDANEYAQFYDRPNLIESLTI